MVIVNINGMNGVMTIDFIVVLAVVLAVVLVIVSCG